MSNGIPELKQFDEASLDAAFSQVRADAERSAAEPNLDREQFRLDWLGRKQGRLKAISDAWLKAAPVEAKKLIGQRFNELKQQVEALVDESAATAVKVEVRSLDISLPGSAHRPGAEHPLTKTMNELVSVFERMGYSVGIGPEVETDFLNFESLNFPPNHPARDTQDTLVLADQEQKPLRERLLMRTHTSPVQIRTMLAQDPPLRIVIPGKVHRNEAQDATHSPMFHQVEGLCVDTNITFSDLKGTLDHAMKSLFGSSMKTRFFPSFFPFTEPSADVQISCPFCNGKGCRKCKHSGWIELLGCGMVDPNVFKAVDARRIELGLEPKYDPAKISGFAFGMGIDRMTMMKYSVSEIGLLFSGDTRFLSQFA
ncbi:phenylalanyl-tRNA synthetase, alpha subunit [Bryocella elongata]|uniref:Phenylalanine--tRNA ligase alpha subunit n=1 Tax=Bryocella elongata TaxID=863522 RepID=A0A1H6BGG3_9BACT|nr:phenylalanine--tRNA ligase subunit alpha [Bryocella elongata]SEG59447.1 phenylalanyl-tRNA synthetase, alpha subunit [Bryocella elongata]